MACCTKKSLTQGTYDRSSFHFLVWRVSPAQGFVDYRDPSVHECTKTEVNNKLSTSNLPTTRIKYVRSFYASLLFGSFDKYKILLNNTII